MKWIFIVSLFVFFPVKADWFGPDNYDDCILESVNGITNDRAAGLVRRSCQNKFPNNNIKPAEDKRVLDREGKVTPRIEQLIKDDHRGLLKGKDKMLFDEAVERGMIVLPKCHKQIGGCAEREWVTDTQYTKSSPKGSLWIYAAERGASMLPISLIISLIIYIFMSWLINAIIKHPEKRALFYISASSLLTSIYFFYESPPGRGAVMYVEEIPFFTLSGIIMLYVLYIPLFLVKKIIAKQRSVSE